MIDLHCHVLDETECGPQSFAESVEICRQAAKDGVRTIVATPLWNKQADEPPLSFTNCQRKLDRLQHETRGALSLKLGFLMQFRVDLARLLERYGSSLTLGRGRYVLVLLPSLQTPPETEAVWRDVAQCGFSTLLARPECSPALRGNQARLQRWIDTDGVMLQIDAASITGAHGREVQRFALQCIQEYPESVIIASGVRRAGALGSSLSDAHKEITKRTGPRRASLLVSETPSMIVRNADNEQPRSSSESRPSRTALISLLHSARPKKTFSNAS